jgi:hypothetical protein
LIVDWQDKVWLRGPEGPHFLGLIDTDPAWPSRLGPEPSWYLTELAMLLDEWEDSTRFAQDYRREIEDTFRRQHL